MVRRSSRRDSQTPRHNGVIVMRDISYFERLLESVALIVRHPPFPGKPEAIEQCAEEIEELIRSGGITGTQGGTLPVPELSVLPAEGSVFSNQLVRCGPTVVLGLDGGQDLLGGVVDALAAATGLLGLLGDSTAGAGEPSGRVGDPANKGYGGHGDGSSGVCAVDNRTHEVHPPKNQEGTGGSLPSVNLKTA
jgi:hypothetical protein